MDFHRRVKKLRRLMAGRRLGALLITDNNDIAYYTGYGEEGAMLVMKPYDCVLLLPPLNNFTARLKVPHEFLKKGGLKKHLHGTVGYDESNLTVEQFLRLKKLHPLVPAAQLIKKPREIKDEAEVQLIHHGCETNKKIVHALELAGKTEQGIAREIHLLQIEQGAGQAFETIVASGRNSSFIHYTPGTRMVKKGDIVVLDLGAKVGGYCSDNTRTVVLGESQKSRKLVAFVEQVQLQLLDQIRPGASVSGLQELYEKILKKHGYRARHLFGHGIGLGVHEPLGGTLREGMVITVEPGIYLPWGGCRVEDVVLVGKKPRIL